MNRIEFYQKLEKVLKRHITLPGCIEYLYQGYWYVLNLDPEYVTPTTQFRYNYSFGNYTGYIEDKAFDKFYSVNAVLYWGSQADIKYNENDFAITLNNVEYIMLDDFAKNFFRAYTPENNEESK